MPGSYNYYDNADDYFVLIGLKIIVFSKTIVVVMLIELIVSNISMRGKATRLAYNVISEDIYK